MEDQLFQLFLTFVSDLAEQVLFPLIVAAIIAGVKYLRDFVNAWVASQQPQVRDFIHVAASIAVNAVEQTSFDQAGEEKLAEAISIGEAYLAAHGLEVDLDLLKAAIEAEVLQVFNSGPILPPPSGSNVGGPDIHPPAPQDVPPLDVRD